MRAGQCSVSRHSNNEFTAKGTTASDTSRGPTKSPIMLPTTSLILYAAAQAESIISFINAASLSEKRNPLPTIQNIDYCQAGFGMTH